MVLEAVEDQLRTEYSEQRVDRAKYTIEHVLPQSWQQHWPLPSDDSVMSRTRGHLLHTLGNLTLVTAKLNPKLSNGPWFSKREALGNHSVLRLNHELLATAVDSWSEEQISIRTAKLSALVAKIWPRP